MPRSVRSFFDVAVGESVAEIPADSQHDQLGREPVTDERGTIHRRRLIPEMTHSDNLACYPVDPSTQQCPFKSYPAASVVFGRARADTKSRYRSKLRMPQPQHRPATSISGPNRIRRPRHRPTPSSREIGLPNDRENPGGLRAYVAFIVRSALSSSGGDLSRSNARFSSRGHL
jgi:hypothetical protein